MTPRVRMALLTGCLALALLAAPEALASADLVVRGPYDDTEERALRPSVHSVPAEDSGSPWGDVAAADGGSVRGT